MIDPCAVSPHLSVWRAKDEGKADGERGEEKGGGYEEENTEDERPERRFTDTVKKDIFAIRMTEEGAEDRTPMRRLGVCGDMERLPREARAKTHLEVKATAGEVPLTVAVLLALRGVEHVGEVAVEVRQEATLVVGVVTVWWIWEVKK